MDWLGILKGTAFSIVCLGLALRLLRSARAKARRHRNRTFLVPETEFVRCSFADHMVSRRRAVVDGVTYDGAELYICHRHRFDRKRLLNARESEAS